MLRFLMPIWMASIVLAAAGPVPAGPPPLQSVTPIQGEAQRGAAIGAGQGRTEALAGESEIAVAVQREYDSEYRQTSYRIDRGDCRLIWLIRDTEPGVVLHRSSCRLPLEDQAPLLSSLLEAVVASRALAQSEWTLYWGRLGPSNSHCFELSKRLMLAAHQTKDWDSKRGKPARGHENAFVRMISNQALIYPELKALFEAQGLAIEVSCVEKVLVLKAKDLPCYPELKTLGVGPDEKLPFDGQLWFRVR